MDEDNRSNEEIEEEIEASADSVNEEKLTENDLAYIHKFSKPYVFDGETYTEIDLTGLKDFTTADAERVDRVMMKMGHRVTNKIQDTTYIKHLAMRVTGKPVEFFNSLPWKEMLMIQGIVQMYLLS